MAIQKSYSLNKPSGRSIQISNLFDCDDCKAITALRVTCEFRALG